MYFQLYYICQISLKSEYTNLHLHLALSSSLLIIGIARFLEADNLMGMK